MKLKELLLFLLLLLLGLCFATDERLKRQLFREQIPHHRPLSGNIYHMHHGFPHPGRFNDNDQQIIPPSPNQSTTPGPDIPPGEVTDRPMAPPSTEVDGGSFSDNGLIQNFNVLNDIDNNHITNNIGHGHNENSPNHIIANTHKYHHLNSVLGYWNLGNEIINSPYPYSWSFVSRE